MFDNIAGYDDVKKELITIANWYNNKEKYLKEGIDLPKGVIFHGKEPGNGKSLFALEFTKLFKNATVFKIEGNDNNESYEETIYSTFKKARECNNLAIILLDEIDMIIDASVDERAFLSSLDGYENSNNIFDINNNVFVIGTTNHLHCLSKRIIRRGRIDYLIGISLPNDTERKSILEYYMKKYKLSNNVDIDYIVSITKGLSVVDLKAICNEVILRYGKSPSLSNYEKEIFNIIHREDYVYGNNEEKYDITTAYHEASHAMICYKNRKYIKFYKASLETKCTFDGVCASIPTKYQKENTNRIIADIEISLAGNVATRLFFNYVPTGAENDMQRACSLVEKLVGNTGYAGIENTISYDRNAKEPSEHKLSRNERIQEKILKKCEKKVKHYLIKNRKKLDVLANYLFNNKELDSDYLEKVMNTH